MLGNDKTQRVASLRCSTATQDPETALKNDEHNGLGAFCLLYTDSDS